MLRRSVRSMRLLGFEDPCLPNSCLSLERMKQSYPELETGFDRIAQIAYAEEDAFRRTPPGHDDPRHCRRADQVRGSVLAGDQAFALHDTYGFPIDLTFSRWRPGAGPGGRSRGLHPPDAGATRTRQGGREGRSPATTPRSGRTWTSLGATDFRAYEELTSEATVVRTGRRRRACRGTQARPARGRVILDRTPSTPNPVVRSPTMGISSDGAHLKVVDVQRPIKGLIAHTVEVLTGRSGLARPFSPRSTSRGVAAVGPPGALGHSRGPRGLASGPRPITLQSGSGELAGLPSGSTSLEPGLSAATRSEGRRQSAVRQDLPVRALHMTQDRGFRGLRCLGTLRRDLRGDRVRR